MRLGCLLLIVAICLIWFGAEHGGIWLGASWLGADFLLLSLAHFFHRPGLFGKKSDGTLSWWSWPVFLPLHCWSLFLWRLAATLTRESAFHRFDDTVALGRRLAASEFPDGFDNCVDLTAEFTEPGPLRRLPGYIALPTLDGAAPDPAAVADVLARLRPGVTYVHCAQGHGRTAAFALALLLKRGDVKTVEEGLEKLRAVRPGIRLSQPQVKFVRDWAASIQELGNLGGF